MKTTYKDIKTGKVFNCMSEKQFYESLNSEAINEMGRIADLVNEDEKLANKSRRNKVMSEHTCDELMNPISRNQIIRECEIADTEDIINNSVEDYQMEMERDLSEEEKERYCDEREDEFFKWGEGERLKMEEEFDASK